MRGRMPKLKKVKNGQTHERAQTVAFRVRADEKLLFQAAATRRGEILSDWLRQAARQALRRDLGIVSLSDSPTRGPETGRCERDAG